MFEKLFSFKGTFNRKEYLLYGIVLPLVVIVFAGMVASLLHGANETVMGIIFLIILLLNIYIPLAATVKRARDTSSSVALIMFLWVFLTPIAVIYLLFAPGQERGENGESKSKGSLGLIVVIIFAGIVVMGILAAVAIPKLAKVAHQAEAQQAQLEQNISQEQNSTP